MRGPNSLWYVAFASLLSGPKSKSGGGLERKSQTNDTPWWPKGMNAKSIRFIGSTS